MLHVILGHIPESTIKRIVKNNLVNGLKFSYEQIQKLETWYLPNMHDDQDESFSDLPHDGTRQLEFGQQVRSIDGYRYVALYVDHCTNKLMVYGMKRKDELGLS